MAEFVTEKENTRRIGVIIVCALIDLVALVLGVLSIKEAGDLQQGEGPDTVALLRGQVQEKRATLREKERAMEEFSHPIGWSFVARTSADPNPSGSLISMRPDWSGALMLQKYLDQWNAKLKTDYDIAGFKTWEESRGEGALTLSALLDTLTKQLKTYTDEAARLEGEIGSLQQQERELLGERQNKDKKFREEIGRVGGGGMTEEFVQLLKNQSAQTARLQQEHADLTQQLKESEDKLTQYRKETADTIESLEQQLETFSNRINWILQHQEEAQERKDPDGKILAVQDKFQIVWIDITHKDRAFRGMRFRVYSIKKGGVKEDKGEIEIIEVGTEHSQAAIVRQFGEDPIQEDDRIYDEHYERGKARQIAIAGRLTGKLSNEQAVRQIREFGDEYQERADERTSYVVLGEGYETHPNFKIAQDLGMKVMLEKYFYDYLGIP